MYNTYMILISYFISITMLVGFIFVKVFEKSVERNDEHSSLSQLFLQDYVDGNFIQKVVFIFANGARISSLIMFNWYNKRRDN